MNNHIQISITHLEPGQAEMLIAQLSEAGFDGFEECDHVLRAFISEKKYDRKLVQELLHNHYSFTEQLIPEQNWNSLWESNFEPVIVNDPVTLSPWVSIRAHFHPPVYYAEYDILITPKMSFGTGHHATTYLMIQQMRKIDFSGKRVFDFGTGTGILAILAAMMGALHVVASDNDTWSIDNASENIRNNHCKNITIKQSDSVTNGPYDIILANINRNIILDNISTIAGQLAPQGVLLISGLLVEDIRDMIAAASNFSLQLTEKTSKNNWVCLRFSPQISTNDGIF